MPVARKQSYQGDAGITVEPIPWRGGDQELASLSFTRPGNWLAIGNFFLAGTKRVKEVAAACNPDRVLCMWAVPAGWFGWRLWKTSRIPYDVWALGSDIWRIRNLPLGAMLLRAIMKDADRLFADGRQLAADVSAISGRECDFLPSSRRMPEPNVGLLPLQPTSRVHFLYVGRYHRNKGPDVLVEAVARLKTSAKEKLMLHMFGVGELKGDLMAAVQRRGLQSCVSINDTIDAREFSDYLSRVKYLVIPSRIESIPVVLSDGAQRGVPFIASDTGDVGTLVSEYGAGFVVPPSNPGALAAAIEQALVTDSSSFHSGSRRLAELFSVASACKRWTDGC